MDIGGWVLVLLRQPLHCERPKHSSRNGSNVPNHLKGILNSEKPEEKVRVVTADDSKDLEFTAGKVST